MPTARLRLWLGFAKRALRFRSLRAASTVQRHLPAIAWPLEPAPIGRVRSPALGLDLDPVRHEAIFRQMKPYAAMAESGLARFEMENDVPVLVAGPVRVALDRRDKVDIIAEVFGEGVYDVSLGRDALALDIGMNMGLASLYFAGVKGWETVGFEPFPPTYAAARAHIEASHLAHRIETREVGLSDADGEAEIPYDPNWTGRNGLFYAETYGEAHGTQTIRLVDAARVVREMRERAGDRALVVKMDCEGAEYAIFDRLAAEGLLGAIDAIVLEYHDFVKDRDPREIERLLIDAGFAVLFPRARARTTSLMWGVRLLQQPPLPSTFPPLGEG